MGCCKEKGINKNGVRGARSGPRARPSKEKARWGGQGTVIYRKQTSTPSRPLAHFWQLIYIDNMQSQPKNFFDHLINFGLIL